MRMVQAGGFALAALAEISKTGLVRAVGEPVAIWRHIRSGLIEIVGQ